MTSEATKQAEESRAYAAVKTLESMGYDWLGGARWRPPLGSAHQDRINLANELSAQADFEEAESSGGAGSNTRELMRKAAAMLVNPGPGTPEWVNVGADMQYASLNMRLKAESGYECKTGLPRINALQWGAITAAAHAPLITHQRTQGKYLHLGEAKLQTDFPLSDNANVQVYRGTDGQMWVRPNAEFLERFAEQ